MLQIQHNLDKHNFINLSSKILDFLRLLWYRIILKLYLGINGNKDKIKVSYFKDSNNYYMNQNYKSLGVGDIALIKDNSLHYIDSVYYKELHRLDSILLSYDNAEYKDLNNKLANVIFELMQKLVKEYKLFQ